MSAPPRQFTANFYKFHGNKEDDKSKQELTKFIVRMEEVIRKNKDGYLGGEAEAGAADYLFWPWFERLGAISIIKPGIGNGIDKDVYTSFVSTI